MSEVSVWLQSFSEPQLRDCRPPQKLKLVRLIVLNQLKCLIQKRPDWKRCQINDVAKHLSPLKKKITLIILSELSRVYFQSNSSVKSRSTKYYKTDLDAPASSHSGHCCTNTETWRPKSRVTGRPWSKYIFSQVVLLSSRIHHWTLQCIKVTACSDTGEAAYVHGKSLDELTWAGWHLSMGQRGTCPGPPHKGGPTV